MSTLLVGGLIAYDRLARQIRRGHDVLRVAAQIDAMLTEWYSEPNGIPANGRGELPGEGDIYWETQVVNARLKQQWGLRVVRLSVRSKTASQLTEPILSIDLVASTELPKVVTANSPDIPQE